MGSTAAEFHLSELDMKSLSGTDIIEEMMSNRPEDDGSNELITVMGYDDQLSNDMVHENALQIGSPSNTETESGMNEELGIPISEHELHGPADDSTLLAMMDQADTSLTSVASQKKAKTTIKRNFIKRKFGDQQGDENIAMAPVKKWQQKRVQVKTLEGEFSVLMWTSGNTGLSLTFMRMHDYWGFGC